MIGAKDDEETLFWSFPKGHQEAGETDAETAIRETKEETGLDVEITDTAPIETGHYIHNGEDYKRILLFIAKPLNYELKPQEIEVEQIEWVQISEAEKYLTGYYGEAWKEFIKRLH